jgi:hypothetical protein
MMKHDLDYEQGKRPGADNCQFQETVYFLETYKINHKHVKSKQNLKEHNFMCAVLIVASCFLACRVEPNRLGASHVHRAMAVVK